MALIANEEAGSRKREAVDERNGHCLNSKATYDEYFAL